MTEKLNNCISRICNFPIVYKTENLSPNNIVKQCGYIDLFDQITNVAISNYLKDNSDVIDSWILYSEDIRYSPAWGFSHKNDKWIVSYVISGEIKEHYEFENKIEACTKMIMMTMESIRLRI